MTWEKFDNIKGPKGDKGSPGTVGSVSAETAPEGAPAKATLTGDTDVHLHLELPRGARGEQGPPGVASSASATTVPPEEPAKVVLSQHGEAVHVAFEIPRGAPGTNAIPTAEAIGTNLAMADSAARPGFETGLTQIARDESSGLSQVITARTEAALAAELTPVVERIGEELALRPTAASVTAEVAAAVSASPVTEGVRLYSYGHSYASAPNPWTTPNGGEYPHKVGMQAKVSQTFCRARSGTPVMDTLCLAMSPTWDTQTAIARAWTPGSKGIVLLQNYMNEMPMADGVQEKFREMWRRSMRSLLALLSAEKITTVKDLTKRGTWSPYVHTANKMMFAGEDVVFANTVGAEIDATVTGDEAWILATASDSNYVIGSFEVLCAGAVVTTVEANNLNYPYTSTVRPEDPRSFYPCWFRVTGLNSKAGTTGSKKITIRLKTAATVFINGVAQPSTTPPRIFLGKEPLRNPGAASGNAAYVANRAAYDAMATDVAAEFSNVTLVDLDVGWDVSTMVSALDPNRHHPNDIGMSHLAARFTAAIRETITGPTPGVHML